MIELNSEENEPRRREIQRRLAQAVAPNLLSYYRDALQILFGSPQLENASHFVAHAMRDIESGVRRLLLSLLLTPDERAELKPKGEKPDAPEDITHATQIRALLSKLGVADQDRIAGIWLGVAGKRNVKGLHRRAHRHDLRPAPPVDPDWWTELEDLLEFQLDAIERRYADFFPLLDELAAKEKPTEADMTKLNNEIPNSYVMRRAFFEERLKQPGWLAGLREAGIFKRTAQEEIDFEREGVPLPWPETEYLARMAADAAAAPAVMEIALEIDTDNQYVHANLLKAALTVEPVELAIPLALREASWIGGREQLWHVLFPERVADLVIRLATVPEPEASFALARAMLEIRKAPEQPEAAGLLDGERISVRLNEYDYRRAVERTTPALLDLDAQRAFDLFAFLLEGALRASRTAEEVAEKDDHSTWWRRFIDSEEEGPRPYESALVTALLRVARQLIEKEPGKTQEILAALEARGWSIFRRMALHLAAQVGGEVAKTRISDAELFADDDVGREYRELVRSRFEELDDAAREKYLALVEAGPDLSCLEEKDRREKYLRTWQVRELRLVEAHVPAGLRERFPELAKAPEQTEKALEDVDHVWSGREAPSVTAAALLEQEVPAALALLRDWQPKEGWGQATRSDVGNEFAGAVATDPGRFAGHAVSLQDLDPVFARSFFSGLKQALKEGRAFRWAPGIALASWIVERPAATAANGADKWEQTHYQIADLIAEGLHQHDSEIPFAERERVWTLIQKLSGTSAIDEGLGKADPMAASLHTTRGATVHDTVLYALWVRRHIPRAPGDEAPVSGFDEVPEARALLEARLDPSQDSSIATRGAFGYRMTQLTYLDVAWVRDHLDSLFPKAAEHRELRKAARETYLAHGGIYSSVIELLEEEYRDAFAPATAQPPTERAAEQAEQTLPEHLAVVYLRGQFPVDHPLLEDFFEKAPGRMRADFIGTMGRLLAHETTEEVHLERARVFWERRRAQLQKTAKAGDEEASQFGFWFVVERLPVAWRLDEMAAAVKIALAAEPDGRVMEKLAELASEHPAKTLTIAEVMARHPKERWQLDYWMPDLRSVITAARRSDDNAVVMRAKELVSKLIVAGQLGLVDLA